jgi:hypothetical protein
MKHRGVDFDVEEKPPSWWHWKICPRTEGGQRVIANMKFQTRVAVVDACIIEINAFLIKAKVVAAPNSPFDVAFVRPAGAGCAARHTLHARANECTTRPRWRSSAFARLMRSQSARFFSSSSCSRKSASGECDRSRPRTRAGKRDQYASNAVARVG